MSWRKRDHKSCWKTGEEDSQGKEGVRPPTSSYRFLKGLLGVKACEVFFGRRVQSTLGMRHSLTRASGIFLHGQEPAVVRGIVCESGINTLPAPCKTIREMMLFVQTKCRMETL
ncbi:unnamed protein product [Allacma fusca]|uniref:Uncharacterized protein n=1 Tax=Allacma fusca TaxID=39272 RepID=A0A8J2PBV4_9HEXA|nr:unnamed protein product [Allacma fusca]